MIAANDAFLKLGNDDTKYVVGHGGLAKRSDVQEFHDMLVIARDRVEKLFNEGKSEAEVVVKRPGAGGGVKRSRPHPLPPRGLHLVKGVVTFFLPPPGRGEGGAQRAPGG